MTAFFFGYGVRTHGHSLPRRCVVCVSDPGDSRETVGEAVSGEPEEAIEIREVSGGVGVVAEEVRQILGWKSGRSPGGGRPLKRTWVCAAGVASADALGS